MEMSPEYAKETAMVMAERGYELKVEEKDRTDAETTRFSRVNYHLYSDQQELILEVLTYPDQVVKYFLEIARYHGMSSYSFELDSWKHREEFVEFRYYTNPETGGALTFKLTYPASL